MKRFVYADNAATTQMDIEVFNAMKPYLLDEYGNASQPYSFSRHGKMGLKEAREIIASCINAEPSEIYFTSGGTESDNWAVKGTMFASSEKKTLITSQIEHHAILRSADSLEHKGFSVVRLEVSKDGIVEPDTLSRTVTHDTQLVSIMFANNEIGTIQPIKELARVAHSKGALFHTDAVQAIGHIPIDVKELDVDLLSASAHKFNGPKGIGFLYIKDEVKIEPYFDGGSQEHSMRAGTENVASIIGMAYALKNNCKQIESNRVHLNGLAKVIIDKLCGNGNIDFIRNGGHNTLPGMISLSFNGANGESILHRLDLRGICVSTGSACDSVNTNVSHVLKAIELDEKYAKGTIRISLGKRTNVEDAEYLANEIIKIVEI